MKIFKTFSEKELKINQPLVDKTLSLDEDMQKLSDDDLKNKTKEFKERLDNGETLDDILPEAFAVVRETSDRVLGMKHYPVQVHGGIVLHKGQIAEMSTGAGKTLVETLPAYLNALEGKTVHVITVNDYLAERDMQQMSKIYNFLGISSACVLNSMTDSERRYAYSSDIVYGTNNQFGFDYLRDNLKTEVSQRVQSPLHYAIVDEVDSVLIDEAKTPLVIAGEGDTPTDLYVKADEFAKPLKGRFEDLTEEVDPFAKDYKVENVDYVVNEKLKTVRLTEKGVSKAEKFFGVDNLSDIENTELFHHINNALKANFIMHKDSDYIVKNNHVEIVDTFTGRVLEGRRYNEGLHQAIEAKEGVEVQSESKTLASVTFQNFFRMYEKLSGMTGTAMTERDEFSEIYRLDVVAVPDHKPKQRIDEHDEIYVSEKAKIDAIIKKIKEVHEHGQPILVGTTSVEKSEELSKRLKKENIKHNVLNAKNNEREAEIIAQSGSKGAITIATNMAGRGTDILLGGNIDFLALQDLRRQGVSEDLINQADTYYDTDDKEILEVRKKFRNNKDKHRKKIQEDAEVVKNLGGLFVLGTERHESRRIDNQLRGRSGRQGDPGKSKFYISLEDDLIRVNMPEAIERFKASFDYPEDIPITGRMITKAVERAQIRVEANNFQARKNTLQYDNVLNKQRQVIYGERNAILEGYNISDFILEAIKDTVERIVFEYTTPSIDMKGWHVDDMIERLASINIDLESLQQTFLNTGDLDKDDGNIQYRLVDAITGLSLLQFETLKNKFPETIDEIQRKALLKAIDYEWMLHIDAIDQMRKEVSVRAMGQEDPLRAYTNIAFDMFEQMQEDIKEEVTRTLLGVRHEDSVNS